MVGGSSMHNGCVAIKPTDEYLSHLKRDYNYDIPIEINPTKGQSEVSDLVTKCISDVLKLLNC